MQVAAFVILIVLQGPDSDRPGDQSFTGRSTSRVGCCLDDWTTGI